MTIPEKLTRNILYYAVAGALAVGAAFTGIGLIVLHGHYSERNEADLSLALKTRVSAVEQFLQRASDVCLQVTSRSMIRDSLEEYNRGRVSLSWLVQFTTPKLADSLNLSDDIAGISRFDAKGQLVVQVGRVRANPSFSVPAAGGQKVIFQEPLVLAGETFLPVVVPIINREGVRVGTDLIFFKAKALQGIISDQAGLGENGETLLALARNGEVRLLFPRRENQGSPAAGMLPQKERLGTALTHAIEGKQGFLRPEGKDGDFIIFAPVSVEGWGLAVRVAAVGLQAPGKRVAWLFAVIALAITVSGIALLLLLLRPLTSSLQKEMAVRLAREGELRLFRHLLDHSRDGIFIASPVTGRFLDVNEQACVALGYRREELLALSVRDIVPTLSQGSQFSEFIAGLRQAGHMIFSAEYRRKDSAAFPVEINIRYVAGEREYLIAVARDVTERKITDQTLKQSLARLSALNKLASRVVSCLSLEDVARALLHELIELTGADFAILYVLENGDLVPVDTCSRPPFARRSETEPHQVGVCLCGLAAAGKPVYSDNILEDGRCTLSECKNAGLRSFAALPLLKGDVIIGVLGLASLQERLFSQEADFLETLASHAAFGVENARLYDQVKNYAADLEEQVRGRTAKLEERTIDLEKSQSALQLMLQDVNAAKKELEGKIAEIERMNRIFVNRELRMVELKKHIRTLEERNQQGSAGTAPGGRS